MKKSFTFLFLLMASFSFAQQAGPADTLSFCYIKYKLPAGCKTESASQIKCDDYSMSWIYLTPQTLETTPDQLLNQMAGQMKKFKKEPVSCYLLGNRAKGYRVSYKTDQGTLHQLIVWGFANEQPVIVQLLLNKEPRTDEDIPAFPKQLVSFSK